MSFLTLIKLYPLHFFIIINLFHMILTL